MIRLLLSTLLLAACSFAQSPQQEPEPQPQPVTQPAPIGEVAPVPREVAPAPKSAVWAAREAYAFSFVQQVASQWRSGQDYAHGASVHSLPGYAVVWIDMRPGVELRLRSTEQPASKLEANGNGLLYVVPMDDDLSATRAFCVRADGLAAFTNNESRTSHYGRRDLQANDVLAETAEDDRGLRAFPVEPARGRDGNFWTPMTMRSTMELGVTVCDDRGQPIPQAHFSCMPADEEFVVPMAVPAGRFVTTLEGAAQFEGVRAAGLGFVMWHNEQPQWIPTEFATVREGSMRIELPHKWLRERIMQGNESATESALVQLTSAQSQIQAASAIDIDGDGAGEFGTFGELSGQSGLRGNDKVTNLMPPVISQQFEVDRDGIVTRFGYHFSMMLPGVHGVPIAEGPNGGVHHKLVQTDRAEHVWHCYAWPVAAGETGQHVFCVDQTGHVFRMANEDGKYSGKDKAPAPHAAFGDHRDARGRLKSQRTGEDGQSWVLWR